MVINVKIVLTAPATEMSEYDEKNPAIAFSAAFPKPRTIPRSYLKKHLYPPVPKIEGYRVKYAPLGLRRIEAALIESKLFREDDIAIVHPDDLDKVVGEDTRIVGVSVKDPFGLAYVSTTYSALIGIGETINRYEFNYLIKKVSRLRRKHKFHVVMGGQGVWQITRLGMQKAYSIDVIVEGEGEEIAPIIFHRLVTSEAVPSRVRGKSVDADAIPCIHGASIYGAVEITRGCGRGCQFCTPTMHVKRSLPLERIVKDIETNLLWGKNYILLVTEDIFLYGSKIPWEPNEVAIKRLILEILKREKLGLKYVQITHVNLATALYKKDLTKWIAENLQPYAWCGLGGKRVVTTEVGIETGSPRLMARYMAGKCRPFKPEDWPRVTVDALAVMEEYDWVSLATIIVGLPGETPEDAFMTLKLVDDIREHGLRTLLVPLLFIPLGYCALKDAPVRTFNELSEVQVDIFKECWRHNLRVWGAGFFNNLPRISRAILKVMSRFIMAFVVRRYWWRKRIADGVYEELKRYL